MSEKTIYIGKHKKLLFCYVAVMIFVGLGGILTFQLLSGAGLKYSAVLVQNSVAAEDIDELNIYLYIGSGVVRDIFLLTDKEDLRATAGELEDVQAKLGEALDKIKRSCVSYEEIKFVEIIENKLSAYQELCGQSAQLSMDNQNEEAFDLFKTQALPVIKEITEAAEGLREAKSTDNDDAMQLLTSHSHKTNLFAAFLTAVLVLISIFFTVKATHTKLHKNTILTSRDTAQ